MNSNGVIIFQWLGKQLSIVMDQVILQSINGFINVFTVPVYSLITIYLLWKGYLILIGQTEQYFRDYLMTVLKITVITYFALNVVHFTTYIQGGIEALNVALISSVQGGVSSNSAGIYQLLDETLTTAIEQMSYCNDQWQFFHGSTWGWLLALISILVAYLPLLIQAATLIIGTQFLVTMLFVIAPICFIFAMFPASKKVFDAWVSKMLEMSFKLVLAFAVVTFMTTIFSTWVGNNPLDNTLNPYGLSAQLLILGWILWWVLGQVSGMAGSLAGGFATGVLQLSDITQNAAASLKHAVLTAKAGKIAATPITAPTSWAAKSITQSLIAKYNARGDQVANPNSTHSTSKKPKPIDATTSRIAEINKQRQKNKDNH
ncbi:MULTISPECIES: type IV secretion system protein [Photobacterium]|uniref:Type IV secretion system protein n=1 Tax=Photobacterium carnosum TaxID=2023717 RepID=A0A2N4UMM1_9GAMM|nr:MULTISPECIES: type IV secretion system protein [Photobacterium]KAE8175726.1 hypothetical protein CIT27_16835 [Photobacterium carnosum]MBY3790406.1 type IV secretion system protein [Photobacterium carnosum]MCD9481310.1 hypothetical protein [Photobacterium phosphoreum]MCD9485389.1 hypothetical protein [Photobacterium phosphoreum]MCD9512987.1 hypothetical protein [Photobacterium phosphoreum]